MKSKLRLVILILVWERLWRAFWPLTTLALAVLALALFGVLPALPLIAHTGILVVLGLLAFGLFVRGVRAFAWPNFEDARKRLDRDWPGPERPFEALSDSLAEQAGGGTRRLWAAHRERMLGLARRARPKGPHSNLPALDPWGLRLLAGLLVVVGLVLAGPDAEQRIASTFQPAAPVSSDPSAPRLVQLWMSPPSYTGLAPVTLTFSGEEEAADPDQPADRLAIPTGSKITVLAQNVRRATLEIGASEQRLTAVDDGSYKLDLSIDEALAEQAGRAGYITARVDGRAVRRIPYAVIEDAPPSVRFAQPPSASDRWRLMLDYAARDDYEIKRVMARIRPVDPPVTRDPERFNIDTDLPLTGVDRNDLAGTSSLDLTDHPLAGRMVRISLEAFDSAGQSDSTETLEMTLPERVFNHPVARTVIEQRKEVADLLFARDASDAEPAVADPRDSGDMPVEILRIAYRLDRLSDLGHSFNHDVVVALALDVAKSRLLRQRSEEGVLSVMDILWRVALRIEDGELAQMEAAVDDAERALREALDENRNSDGENPVSQAEMQHLIQNLKEAINDYLLALARRMMPEDMEFPDPEMLRDSMSAMSMDELLDRMLDMNRLGSQESLRQQLDQLTRYFEMLRNAEIRRPDAAAMQQAQQFMQQMRDLIERQRALQQETARAAERQQGSENRDGEQGQQREAGQSAEQLAAQQERLRRNMEEMMRQLAEMTGQLPQNMGQAAISMREAESFLNRDGNGDRANAANAQAEALSFLEQGMQDSMQQMLQAMVGGPAFTLSIGRGSRGPGSMPTPGGQYDPLGRDLDDAVDDGSVDIPDEPAFQRSRAILDELRRRAADPARPREERHYIDRLLTPF